jgi:hypothetical protein
MKKTVDRYRRDSYRSSSSSRWLCAGWSADALNIDFATNPLSLIITDKGWIEKKLGGKVTVNWIQPSGSNTAYQALRAGVVDVGSTAGSIADSAALLARANGSPIKAIDGYSPPDLSAILVPVESPITSVKQLAGKRSPRPGGPITISFCCSHWPSLGSISRASRCRICSTRTARLLSRTARSMPGRGSIRCCRRALPMGARKLSTTM